MEIPRILRLDPLTANKIAAGEVVERPSAVVKELVENAMDAGSTQITVEVRQGGKTYIRISDNGCGIHFDDIALAMERHATSKIRSVNDLNTVHSLGFRGEALASIAAVSMLELITRPTDASVGHRLEVQGGRTVSLEETGAPQGTTVIVKDLFFNTPARMKFMKSNGAEMAAITEWISRLAVSKPSVSFRFIADHQDIFMTSGNGKLLEAIAGVYERSLAKSVIPLEIERDGIRLTGFLGDLTLNRGNRQMQHFFVNGRTVRSGLLSEAVEMGYQGLLPINRFPVCFVNLELDQKRLDVNIHPAKIQIRFQDEPSVRQIIFQLVRETLLNRNLMPSVRYKSEAPKGETPAVESFDNKASVMLASAMPKLQTQAMEDAPGVNAATRPETVYTARPEPKSAISESTPSYIGDIPAPEIVLTISENSESSPDPMQMLMKEEPEPVVLSSSHMHTFAKESLYEGLRIIGQLFRTYILAEREDTLYLIDQHAAHEKVLFEGFIRDWKSHAMVTQLLLAPEVITLDPKSVMHSEDLKPSLEQAGFRYDVFGSDALLVREVPLVGSAPLPPELLKTLLQDFVRELEMGKDLTDIRQELIIRESCKKAIKAFDVLAHPEIESLIRQLKELDSPYTCPHGRPIIIAIEKQELEKRFKRI